jgi:hypothetical protein
LLLLLETLHDDDDDAYEDFISDRISKALHRGSAPLPTRQSSTTVPDKQARVVIKPPTSQKPHATKSEQRTHALKRNKKAQVSVFRVQSDQ